MKKLPKILLIGIVATITVIFTVIYPIVPNDISQQITGLSVVDLELSQFSVANTQVSTCLPPKQSTPSGLCVRYPPNSYSDTIDSQCRTLFPQGYSITSASSLAKKNIDLKGCFPRANISPIKNVDCENRKLSNNDIARSCLSNGNFKGSPLLKCPTGFTLTRNSLGNAICISVTKTGVSTTTCPISYKFVSTGDCSPESITFTIDQSSVTLSTGGGIGFTKLWCMMGSKDWVQCDPQQKFPAISSSITSTPLCGNDGKFAYRTVSGVFTCNREVIPLKTDGTCITGFTKLTNNQCVRTSEPTTSQCPTGFAKNTLGQCVRV